MYNDLFIEPEIEINKKERQNASYIRKQFEIKGELRSATITLSACGVYKAFMNGEELDDQILLPGFTYYPKRLQYQTYSILSLLQQGTNVIAAIVGDGWYRGSIGPFGRKNFYGDKIKFLCIIDITYIDGSTVQIITDESWKATQNGPIRQNDLMRGEEYDANLEMVGWNEPDYDESAWHRVIKSAYDGQLIPQQGKKIVEQEHFKPIVRITPDGSTILDFGQNIAGYVSFKVFGGKGHKVYLIHGEALDEQGNFTQKNIFGEPKGQKNKTSNKKQHQYNNQVIEYTLKEGQQQYKPTFSFQGFQYVKLINWPEEVNVDNFQAIAVYSELKQTGIFECSNSLVNKLVQNVLWSQKGNFLDIPTDCPQRERAGWTGDVSVFAEAGSYLMDTQLFLRKWLHDVAAQQHDDGKVPTIVPDVGMFKFMDGSAGWGDAIATVPYVLYQFYNDKEILVDLYENIVRWVEFQEKRAGKSHPVNKLKFGSHRQYIVDTGYHFGEWLEPGKGNLKNALENLFKPDEEVATAYFAYSVHLLSKIAGILNKTADQKKYATIYEKIRLAYQKEFIPDGKITSTRQCKYVRPVFLDLVDEEHKRAIVKDLNELIVSNEYKIGTGFLSTPFVLHVLSDYGYAQTAYRMLENTQSPGWLYSVTKGATTVWENWHGISENGEPNGSLNHYAPGSVVAWLFKTVAGIQPLAAGFEKIRIAPIPGGTLDYVNCSFESRAGMIRSKWKLRTGIFELEVQVPCTAEICLPNGEVHKVASGTHSFACPYK